MVACSEVAEHLLQPPLADDLRVHRTNHPALALLAFLFTRLGKNLNRDGREVNRLFLGSSFELLPRFCEFLFSWFQGASPNPQPVLKPKVMSAITSQSLGILEII